MGGFDGGSAYSMVQQIAEGYLLVTERSLRRLQGPELDRLGFELEKVLRGIRSELPDRDNLQGVKQRNRKIQRLNTCRMLIRTFRLRFRR